MPKIPHVYYDKASSSYYAVASLGFDEVTGKRMQKKKRGFKTQTEAKKWYDDLRHSHASLLLSLGMNDLELKNRLGHADIQTTLGVYSHLRPSAMKEVADKLEGVISL